MLFELALPLLRHSPRNDQGSTSENDFDPTEHLFTNLLRLSNTSGCSIELTRHQNDRRKGITSHLTIS